MRSVAPGATSASVRAGYQRQRPDREGAAAGTVSGGVRRQTESPRTSDTPRHR